MHCVLTYPNILDVVGTTRAQLICAHAHNCLVTQVSERFTHIQKKGKKKKIKEESKSTKFSSTPSTVNS
jgi:hypothetical protein